MTYHSFIIVFTLSLATLGCTSSSKIHIENSMITADLERLHSFREVDPDSSFAERFDTLWKFEKPILVARPNPYEPTIIISFYLANDDSVTIYYVDGSRSIIGDPFRFLLKKGNYRFTPNLRKFPSGVYNATCLIGKFRWTKKIMLMN